jgi:hypothetical protein
MSWKERTRVDERVVLVGEYVKGGRSMAELCREFGISRKTGYKWVARYNAEGPSGLDDRSRAPHGHPNRVTPRRAGGAPAGPPSPPTLGRPKDSGVARPSTTGADIACREHGERRFRTLRSLARAPSAPSNAAVHGPFCRCRRVQPGLARGLQRGASHGGVQRQQELTPLRQ